jgi:hypothetical protein
MYIFHHSWKNANITLFLSHFVVFESRTDQVIRKKAELDGHCFPHNWGDESMLEYGYVGHLKLFCVLFYINFKCECSILSLRGLSYFNTT